MQIHNILFDVVRQTSTSSIQQINDLEHKADTDTIRYSVNEKGFKGLYAKANNGWILQTLLLLLSPLFVAYIIKQKQSILNPISEFEEDDDSNNLKTFI